jgi:hypothetical protein
MEVDAPRADFRKHSYGIYRGKRRPNSFTKRIAAAIADRPQAKGEFVFRLR